MKNAHYSPTGGDAPIWSIKWHSLGHQLVTGCNDHTTKFWCRQRPGVTKAMPSSVRFDPTRSLHNAEERVAKIRSVDEARKLRENGEESKSSYTRSRAVIPGLGEAETDGILDTPAAKALDFDYNEALRRSREERMKISKDHDVGIMRPQAFVCTYHSRAFNHIRYITQITRKSLASLIHIMRISLEYERSNAHT